MLTDPGVVFLRDVDNTLLDNDRFAHLRTLGAPAALSNGDAAFQPGKIQRFGIWTAVEERVLVHSHEERMLEAPRRCCSASHYVMVDDKPRLLGALKSQLGQKLTTVFVRQGHCAVEPAGSAIDPAPDPSFERIGDLLACDLSHLKEGRA